MRLSHGQQQLAVKRDWHASDWVYIAYAIGGQPSVKTRLPIVRDSQDDSLLRDAWVMVAATALVIASEL
jgi:hypothetical protein